MEQLDFRRLKMDYNNQINNLRMYISNGIVDRIAFMSRQNSEYFFDVDMVSQFYSLTSDEGKASFLKVIYFILLEKYMSLVINSSLDTSIYCNSSDYNVNAYLCNSNPLLMFDLKLNNQKIELTFYEDLMETDKTLEILREKALIDEELHTGEKESNKIAWESICFGGSEPTLYTRKSDCNYRLNREYRRIYTSSETDYFTTRKDLISIYFNTLECLNDFYRIDRKNIKENEKVTIKKYPYMDISVVFTNKRDIKEFDESPKVIVKNK